MWPQLFAVNRSWGKTWETPRGFPETPETPLKPPMGPCLVTKQAMEFTQVLASLLIINPQRMHKLKELYIWKEINLNYHGVTLGMKIRCPLYVCVFKIW